MRPGRGAPVPGRTPARPATAWRRYPARGRVNELTRRALLLRLLRSPPAGDWTIAGRHVQGQPGGSGRGPRAAATVSYGGWSAGLGRLVCRLGMERGSPAGFPAVRLSRAMCEPGGVRGTVRVPQGGGGSSGPAGLSSTTDHKENVMARIAVHSVADAPQNSRDELKARRCRPVRRQGSAHPRRRWPTPRSCCSPTSRCSRSSPTTAPSTRGPARRSLWSSATSTAVSTASPPTLCPPKRPACRASRPWRSARTGSTSIPSWRRC